MAKSGSQTFNRTARSVLALAGGYLFTYAACAALARLLPVSAVDAVVIAALAGFVIYLGFMLWAFAASRLRKVVLSLLLAAPLALIGFWPQVVGAGL